MDSRSPERHPIVVACTVILAFCATGVLWSGTKGAGLKELPEPTVAPVDPNAEDPTRARGRFRPSMEGLSEEDQIAALESIGYLSGTREAGEQSSVTVHDTDRAWQGLNLYTSGHAPEAVLMDMEGEVLHVWNASFKDAFPEFTRRENQNMLFWRRVHLLPDGELLAIFEGEAIVKLDRDSNVLWANANKAHHDLEIAENGDIWVLTRKGMAIAQLNNDVPTLNDMVTVLGPDGEEKHKISLLKAYRDSEFKDHWAKRSRRGGDVFHTNSLAILDGSQVHMDPAFKAGNVLVSMRHLNTLAILDPDAEKIVWSKKGEWVLQHDPSLLDNGHVLLFDNNRKSSQILELEPRSDKVVWRYVESPDKPFFSGTCGTAQRLDNGNTLVTESDNGRAFEITTDGEIVWEFHNPNRPEDRPNLVATLFENLRLAPDFPVGWAQAPEATE